MHAAPQEIWVLHHGGLGDIILAADLIASLAAIPGARVTLAARPAFLEVARLFPVPPHEVAPLEFEFDRAPEVTAGTLDGLRAQIARFGAPRVDLLIAAELQPPSWDAVLAAGLRPSRALVGRPFPRTPLVEIALRKLDLSAAPFDCLNESGRAERFEAARYRALAEAAGAEPRSSFPWNRPDAPGPEFPQPYLACFPLGSPGSAVKRWPIERMREAAAAVCAEQNWNLVITGDHGEAAAVEEFAGSLRALRGPERVAVFLGGAADVTRLASVLAHAEAYLGNDTGPCHLAQAYGVPGVAVHSGVTWPHYRPWAPGSIALVHPLGCFDCHCDCLFGHGVCVESIPVAAVTDALRRAVRNPHAAPEAVELDELAPAAYALISDAARVYRQAQADRHARQDTITSLHDQLVTAIEALAKASRSPLEKFRDYLLR